MKKRLLLPILTVAAFFAMAVPALAHDNSISASAVCTSPSSGTWAATFKGVNDFRLSETMTFTGAVSGPVGVAPFGSASKTATGLTGASATAGVYGYWSDGYHNGPPANHTATAVKPPDCSPVVHHPVIAGSATCAPKAGTYTVTYILVNADGGSTPVSFPITHLVSGTSTSDSAAVTFTYGNGPDQTAHATVQLAGTCIPVVHTPAITGTAVCSKHGEYTVTYTLVTADGGVTLTAFPIVHAHVPGIRTSDSASALFTYGNGPDVTAHATVTLSGRCRPPHVVIKAPRARLVGPCGDPYYGAVFNNTRSNRAVTFVWSYINFYTGHRTSVRVKVGAGQKHLVPFRHVLGNTRQSIRTASGDVLVRSIAAPPGNYGACRF